MILCNTFILSTACNVKHGNPHGLAKKKKKSTFDFNLIVAKEMCEISNETISMSEGFTKSCRIILGKIQYFSHH